MESLTTSLIAWKQFESGLHEFKEALGKDKGALRGLKGALDVGQDIVSINLAQDVKEVAKRLSERVDTGAQVKFYYLHYFIYLSFGSSSMVISIDS